MTMHHVHLQKAQPFDDEFARFRLLFSARQAIEPGPYWVEWVRRGTPRGVYSSYTSPGPNHSQTHDYRPCEAVPAGNSEPAIFGEDIITEKLSNSRDAERGSSSQPARRSFSQCNFVFPADRAGGQESPLLLEPGGIGLEQCSFR
jgi:hypothetical protein